MQVLCVAHSILQSRGIAFKSIKFILLNKKYLNDSEHSKYLVASVSEKKPHQQSVQKNILEEKKPQTVSICALLLVK
jgi:hypothetical protein